MNRNIWLVPLLAGAFVASLWWAGSLWLFTAGLLFVVWGVRVSNEITFDAVPHDWVRRYGSAG